MLDKKIHIKVSKNMNIPVLPGVYCFYTGNDIIYIGSSCNLKKRITLSHQTLSKIINDKIPEVFISYIITEKYIHIERGLINRHKPFYNKVKTVLIKTNYPKMVKAMHMAADRELRKLSRKYISKETYLKLAKKHDVSGQTVINYIYGLGSDGFLKQCLIEDFQAGV